MVTYQIRIRKIESAEKGSGATAKPFIAHLGWLYQKTSLDAHTFVFEVGNPTVSIESP